MTPILVCIPMLALCAAPARSPEPWALAPSPWTQLAGSESRAGHPDPFRLGARALSGPAWSTELDALAQSGVVADEDRVIAVSYGELVCLDPETTQTLWRTPIAPPILDSWSTPTIDTDNRTVIHASAFEIGAYDLTTGAQTWSVESNLPIVNASPCLARDIGRVFITDYSFGTSANATLVCINAAPFDIATNPYQPGEILWELTLDGDCSGNTPSYSDGIVFVTTADDGFGNGGAVYAFDATSAQPPIPIWSTPNPEGHGFFSAPTIKDGAVYASSYNFHQGQRASNTVKLDAATGALIWSVPTVRTNAAPVVLGNGLVVVSGGVPTSQQTIFTGSLPAIELIEDRGESAAFLWDSFEQTHDDLNANGAWDPGEPFLSIGGWGHHPIAFGFKGRTHLLVGTMGEPTFFDPLTHGVALRTIDLSKHPTDPGFIVSTTEAGGTTPALVGDTVYSTDREGLHIFKLEGEPAQPALSSRTNR